MRGRLENDCTENYANGKVWLKKLVGSFRFYSIIIRVFRLPKGTPPKKKKKKKQIKKIVFKDGGEEYRRLFKYSSIQGRDSARGHHVKMFILV
jgi:hypothetical protein